MINNSSIMRKIFLINVLLLFCLHSYSQKVVSGTVKDEAGQGLSGVSIVQKDATNATMTKDNGAFELIMDNKKPDVLLFSMIGYKSQELNVNGLQKMEVTLIGESKDLDQVVVIGYGTQRKVSVTGAVSSVGAEDLKKAPVASVTNALTGRVPGLVTRQTSGRPGQDDAQLFIRGRATTNNSNPLVLVDGVERDFTQVEPDDIESVSILKDAAATAVFGVRGANGVVLVTTKRGSQGKSKINLSSEYGVTHFNRVTEALNAETTSIFQREGTINVGLDPSIMSNTSNFLFQNMIIICIVHKTALLHIPIIILLKPLPGREHNRSIISIYLAVIKPLSTLFRRATLTSRVCSKPELTN